MKFFLALHLILIFKITLCQKPNFDSIRVVLEKTYDDDQKYRLMLDSIEKKYSYNSPEISNHWKIINYHDSLNVIIVKNVINKYGWLSIEETSKNANNALFLVIQHSSLDIQLKYLPILEKAVKNKKASAKNYAYLLDRVNMNLGKYQIYGTQLQILNGITLLYPIKDEKNVNARRKKIGLDSLEIYAKKFNFNFTVQNSFSDKDIIIQFIIQDNVNKKPLSDVGIYFESGKFIGKTNKNGFFQTSIKKSKLNKKVKFVFDGKPPFAIPINNEKIKKNIYQLFVNL